MTPPSIDTAASVFVALAVLAVIIERGLSLVFEHPWWLASADHIKGMKEILALLVCYGVVRYLGFDAISLICAHNDAHTAGLWITAAALAGGSKGSAKLFVDLWDIQSNAARRAQVVTSAENVIEDKKAVAAVVVAAKQEEKREGRDDVFEP